MISKEYLEWINSERIEGKRVGDENFFPLTNTQHRFAEWLLEHDNAKMIMQIGSLKDIFISVREHLKDGGSYIEEYNE